MSQRSGFPPMLMYCMALRLTALWVPRAQRKEWLAEWVAELRYVCEERFAGETAGRYSHREVAAFCRGALDDAHCVRDLHGHAPVRAAGSAMGCLLWLGCAALLCGVVASSVPAVRRSMQASLYRNDTRVVTISPAALPGSGGSGMRLGTVRGWQHRPQHLFSEFGFYRSTVEQVRLANGDRTGLIVARASSNLLSLLSRSVLYRPGRAKDSGRAEVLLSEEMWRSRFGGDRDVVGRVVTVGTEQVVVGGVVADTTAPVGRRVDAWLLMREKEFNALPDSTQVFVVARMSPSFEPGNNSGARWQMTASEDGQAVDFNCVALSNLEEPPWHNYLFAVFLAVLSLPAMIAVRPREYASRSVRIGWVAAARRWIFLWSKAGLALVAIYFGTLVLAYGFAWQSPSSVQYVQLVSVFGTTLYALQWSLRDQGERCPVCLGKLRCPARVGDPSRNFLTWNGTELMCTVGHGLLHVPEMPTSWFSKPRWLELDASWKSLFPRPA